MFEAKVRMKIKGLNAGDNRGMIGDSTDSKRQ